MPRVLANWLRAYSEYTKNSEAPGVFNFWTGVYAVAGAMRRNVWIDEIKFRWYPNFYIIFVSPPGVVTKSTTIGVGTDLLRKVEGVKMGPDSMTWQGLTRGLQDAHQLVPMQKMNGNASLEKMLNMEYVPMSAISCEVSELGTFLDPRDTHLSSVLIDLWDGKDKPWERWLATKEDTKIENPWVNIIAATTPSWLRENFPEGMIGGGLTSRVIFVYAEKKSKLVPYISQVVDEDVNKELRDALIHDLNEIGELRGRFQLSKEAVELGTEWYKDHWTNTPEHLTGENFSGYIARKQTHIHKLAMVLTVAESDELTISAKTLQMSINFITGIEYDMNKVFESIGVNITSKHVNTILSYLRVYDKMTRQELWRYCIKTMSPKEFNDAIDASVTAGYLMIRPDGTEAWFQILPGGRNTSTARSPQSDSEGG